MRKVLSPLLFLNKELRDQALTVVLAVRKYNLYLWELYSLPSLLVRSFPAVEVLTLAPGAIEMIFYCSLVSSVTNIRVSIPAFIASSDILNQWFIYNGKSSLGAAFVAGKSLPKPATETQLCGLVS